MDNLVSEIEIPTEDDAFIVKVGDTVYDDLTGFNVKVLKLTNTDGIIGIWLESDWLGGGRHPWEISWKNENE